MNIDIKDEVSIFILFIENRSCISLNAIRDKEKFIDRGGFDFEHLSHMLTV